ncbi:hypothetical protein [Shewanella frigidimarina]|uniref:hypothetical protein n=1 Tax=Shewanella frigidimarina TaxID=56812 RepID=UPI003D7A6A6D
MSLSNLHRTQFPYAVKLIGGNVIQFVNREYLPLGVTDKKYPKEFDVLTKLTVTPETIECIKELAVNPLDNKFVFLYDDNSSPELSDEMNTRYLGKLKQLISINLTPPDNV